MFIFCRVIRYNFRSIFLLNPRPKYTQVKRDFGPITNDPKINSAKGRLPRWPQFWDGYQNFCMIGMPVRRRQRRRRRQRHRIVAVHERPRTRQRKKNSFAKFFPPRLSANPAAPAAPATFAQVRCVQKRVMP